MRAYRPAPQSLARCQVGSASGAYRAAYSAEGGIGLTTSIITPDFTAIFDLEADEAPICRERAAPEIEAGSYQCLAATWPLTGGWQPAGGCAITAMGLDEILSRGGDPGQSRGRKRGHECR